MMLSHDYSNDPAWTLKAYVSPFGSGKRIEYDAFRTKRIPDVMTMTHTDCVNGGSVCWDIASDTMITGNIDVVDSDFELGEIVTLWVYVVDTVENEYSKKKMCDLYPDDVSLMRLNGGNDGTLSCYSAISLAKEYVNGGNGWVPAGTRILQHFVDICYDACLNYDYSDVLSPDAHEWNLRFPQGHMWGYGKSLLSEISACADALGCQVRQSADGTSIVLYRDWNSGQTSVPTISRIQPGIIFHQAETVNRVICEYKNNGREVMCDVRLPATDPKSFQNIGRWFIKKLSYSSLPLETISADFEPGTDETMPLFLFIAEWEGSGSSKYVRFRNASSGLYLDRNPNDNAVRLAIPDGSDNQAWRVDYVSGGAYIRPKLDLSKAVTRTAANGIVVGSGTLLNVRDYGSYQVNILAAGDYWGIRAAEDESDSLRANATSLLNAYNSVTGTYSFTAEFDPDWYVGMTVDVDYDDGATTELHYGCTISKINLRLDNAGLADIEVIAYD